MSQKDDPANDSGVFARVKRIAGERRAESDRKSAARRAAEMKEVARQIAARKAERKAPAADAAAAKRDEDEDSEQTA